jgi:hypothetical protein
VSAGIKRMLAERAALAARASAPIGEPDPRSYQIDPRREARITDLFDRIGKAAPYIDNEATGWLPSIKLKLIWCTVVTGLRPENAWRAYRFIEQMLELARLRYLVGIHPDPFREEARSIEDALRSYSPRAASSSPDSGSDRND